MKDMDIDLKQSVGDDDTSTARPRIGPANIGFKPSRLPSGRSPLWPFRLNILPRFLFGFPGYLFPFNAIFIGLALLFIDYPGYQSGNSVSLYYLQAWLRNATVWVLFAGTLHLWFNVFKRQGNETKYVGKWETTYNKKYTFGRQVYDNVFWSMLSGVTIWTMYETATVYVHQGRPSILDGSALSAIYFVLLFPLNTAWLLTHFYFQHRILHHPSLYERFHSVHHRNTNTGPLSGLSMHPVEHLVYFSAVLIYWILPCDPIHYQYAIITLALAPAYSHAGFDTWRFGKKRFAFGDYEHFLHHRLFNVNFGGKPLVPLDLMLGTHHDGSAEADQRMRERLRKKRSASAPVG